MHMFKKLLCSLLFASCTNLPIHTDVVPVRDNNIGYYMQDKIGIEDVRNIETLEISPFHIIRVTLMNGAEYIYCQDGSEKFHVIVDADDIGRQWIITYDIRK